MATAARRAGLTDSAHVFPPSERCHRRFLLCLVFDDKTQTRQVDTARDARQKINLLSLYGPLLCLLLGVLLLIGGLLVLRSRTPPEGSRAANTDTEQLQPA